MKSILVLLSFGILSGLAVGAQHERPVKFPVMSADPYLIKTLLEGGQATEPELSTLWFLRGMPRNSGKNGSALLQGGHLMVNPTDNALWWIPDPVGG